MAKRITEEAVTTTRNVRGNAASVSSLDGTNFEVDLLSVTMLLSIIPRFSHDGLDSIVTRSLYGHELFKKFRASQYLNEWTFLSRLPDRQSSQWTMLALAFCSQVAIEASVIYPFLASDACDWLRANTSNRGWRTISKSAGMDT